MTLWYRVLLVIHMVRKRNPIVHCYYHQHLMFQWGLSIIRFNIILPCVLTLQHCVLCSWKSVFQHIKKHRDNTAHIRQNGLVVTDLCSGGPWFKPWLAHHLFWLSRGFSQPLQANARMVHQLSHHNIVPNSFQFISHPTIGHCIDKLLTALWNKPQKTVKKEELYTLWNC
jgi:hypothetical protein